MGTKLLERYCMSLNDKKIQLKGKLGPGNYGYSSRIRKES